MGSRPFRLRPWVPGTAGSRVGIALAIALTALPMMPASAPAVRVAAEISGTTSTPSNTSAVGNFSSAIGRLVTLLGIAGSGLLALVWARVALSWFSHDITKKVQAKDRARDALVGTLLFVAALTGLIWGLAHWVLTGT